MGLLSLFTFFMVWLVTSTSLIQLFIGWEGIHQCLIWCKIKCNNEKGNFGNFGATKNYSYFHSSAKKGNGLQRIGPHNLKYLSLIVGSVLGDSHLEKRTVSGGTRIIFEICSENVSYLMWFHQTLAIGGYLNPVKPKLKIRIGANNKVRYSYRISSYTFNSLNWLHSQFYVANRKTIFNDLEAYLTPLALAVWYMDDGSYIKSSKTGRIATNNFHYEEVVELCNILKKKYNLKIKPHSQGKKGSTSYILYISKGSFPSFTRLVETYIVSSMRYKLGN